MTSLDQSKLVAPALEGGRRAANVHDEAKAAVAEEPKAERKFASRDEFLGASGARAEAEIEVDGIGWLLLCELTGDARAEIIGRSASAMQRGELDVRGYQRALLLAGVVDPVSSETDRQPLFRPGDADRVMKVGGKTLQKALDKIEELSGMGRYQESAEENSNDTPSGAGTSA